MITVIVIIMLIWVTLGIISSIYLFQVVNVLNKEGVSSNVFEFYFSYDKFKKFIKTCNGDKKIKYTKLYKRAVWSKRIPILLFICLLVFVYFLFALR